MPRPRLAAAFFCLLVLTTASAPLAAQVELQPGDSVQAAIDAADPGAVISLAGGLYPGDVDFGGKALTLLGSGPHTVLQGSGSGPVVRFENGEGHDTILDGLTVTGGQASQGGGILIVGADPTIVRCVITGNQTTGSGSGIHVAGGSQARLFNNVVSYNSRDDAGDPHGIQVVGSSPAIVNNTIVRNDSNGILVSGGSPLIMNNVIASNGSVVGGAARGRGICDFSGGGATLVANLFHRNRVSAVLRDGKDWRRITALQKKNNDPLVLGNVDGRPGFVRNPPRKASAVSCHDLAVCDTSKGRAVDAGFDDEACRDLDGSRNTIGHTGGPFAPGSRTLPGDEHCSPPVGS